MKSTTDNWQGSLVLLLAHVAGMIDLVALPVWVGTTLIGQYHLGAPLAGGMVTAYLLAAAAASMIFAGQWRRINVRWVIPFGYTIAALAFVVLTQTHNPALMLAMHLLAGFSVGTALSFVHGTIGRSAHPHRLFAIVTFGLGVTGIIFLGVAQNIVPLYGGYVLFVMFAGLMSVAALATAIGYPRPAEQRSAAVSTAAPLPAASLEARIWWGIVGVTIMATSQAMMFSFVERIGVAHGFGARISIVLVIGALVNLLAAVVAGLLERRLNPLKVALTGAAAQATLALLIVFSSEFSLYMLGVDLIVAAMIITHTFVFGWLSVNDSTSKSVALTPAMLMTGAAVGPVLAGVLFANSGPPSLGIAALLLDIAAATCFLRAYRFSARTTTAQQILRSH